MPRPDQKQAPLYPAGVDIVNDYQFEPGVCILPLAEDPPEMSDEETGDNTGALKDWSPVVVLRLHAPYRVRRQTTSAKKQNTPPVVPSPADAGKFVFAGGAISIANALNMTNANFDWLVNTEYVFVENCVSRNQDGFVLGAPPYDTLIETGNSQAFGILPSQLPTGMGPEFGAVASAGSEAQTGWMMAQNLFSEANNGVYGYNNRSFYPGNFLDDKLSND